MPENFRRPLIVALFLLALLAGNSLWVLAGGQYHLDLMFWAWKLLISVSAASLTVLLATSRGKRAWAAAILLAACLLAAGWLTYYAHLNEPADEDDMGDQLSHVERTFPEKTPG